MTALWLLAPIALAQPELSAADPGPGTLEERLAPGFSSGRPTPGDGADLVLLYSGEQEGEIGPCGCGRAGGLPRLATYAAAVRQSGVPTLLLDPGGWMASVRAGDELSSWSKAMNAAYHRALYELRFDAFNVGYRDLPGAVTAPHPGYVSATHRPAAAPVSRYKTFELGGLRVAVTGVSRDGLVELQPPMRATNRPVAAVEALLPELADHDIVVVMVYELPVEARVLAGLPGVDVVIEAGGYEERWPAVAEGDGLWVRSLAGGSRAGELRLWVEDGRVARAVDRQVPLDGGIEADARLERLERAQDQATAP
jgi:hypothetical protein